ncbi:MAG: FAD-dependent oxidoreductase [Actinobacteria bacterium]|nr:FAD-dependent oxidoreductase [Actinomycetota bacterium]
MASAVAGLDLPREEADADDLRVAVVGSGPAGIYAAAALTAHNDAAVDVIDRLPTPFGLVRYGVAPDHEKMKSVAVALRKVMEHQRVRFLGNIELGADVSVEDLHGHYDAIIVANGAAVDRRLAIGGEDLPGSFSATEFVSWYSGHPDSALDKFALTAQTVIVIGVGNVAIDVARVLLKTVDELKATDVPDHVLAVVSHSHVRDVMIVGRRGPAYAKFTTKELRELGELANADVIVPPEDLALDHAAEAELAGNAVARRNFEVLRAWSERTPQGRPRRLHMRFCLRPSAICGDACVTGMEFARGRPDGAGGMADTGQSVRLPADMVLRSVGYRGVPIPGLPFDEKRGVIPNTAGRILRDGAPAPGEYVAGWIKRGPSGVIGTNKHDAAETVRSLLEDAPTLPRREIRDPEAIIELLHRRGVRVVPWEGWEAIEALEIATGRRRGAKQVKVAERELLLAAALSQPIPELRPVLAFSIIHHAG